VLLVGVGAVFFVKNLGEWDNKIASQQTELEGLQAESKTQKTELANQDDKLSDVIKTQKVAKDDHEAATHCQESMQKFYDALKASNEAAANQALSAAVYYCDVTV
jgi:hypothetical protein